MSGWRRRGVIALTCAAAGALSAAAPAQAERRVFFTIKSVTALYESHYDIPRAVAPLEGNSDGCPVVYRSRREREVVTLRSTRPTPAEAVYDTRSRPRHWRMNRRPYRLPSVQTVQREIHATQEQRNEGSCPYWAQDTTDTYDCGGPEVYTVKRDTGIGPTVGPHTVRNTFEVENWLGTNPSYLHPNHPLAECDVRDSGLRVKLQSLRNGMWMIGRGRWKRKTLSLDRTLVGETCIGRDPFDTFGNPGPPCGPITTHLKWTVKLVRRPAPRQR